METKIAKHQEAIKEIIQKSNQTLLKVEEIKEKRQAETTGQLKPYNITKDESDSIFTVIRDFPKFNNPNSINNSLLDQSATFSEYKNHQESRIIQNSCILRKLIDLMLKLNQVNEEINENEDSDEDEDTEESDKENL